MGEKHHESLPVISQTFEHTPLRVVQLTCPSFGLEHALHPVYRLGQFRFRPGELAGSGAIPCSHAVEMKQLVDAVYPGLGPFLNTVILQPGVTEDPTGVRPTKGERDAVVSFGVGLLRRISIDQQDSLDDSS